MPKEISRLLKKSLLCIGLLVIALFLLNWVLDQNFEIQIGHYLYELGFILLAIWFYYHLLYRKKINALAFFGSNRKTKGLQGTGYFLVALFCSSICLAILTAKIVLTLFPESANELFMSSFQTFSFYSILSALTSIIIAPIVEEIFFRGLLFQTFKSKSGFTLAAVLSSFIFAFFHLITFVDALIFGIAMCVIFQRTKKLNLTILLHMIYNAIAYILLVIDGWSTGLQEQLVNSYWIIFLVLEIFFLTIIVLFFSQNWLKSDDRKTPYESNLI